LIRFTQENWNKFQQGKQTTIRFHAIKNGEHNAYTGPRFKPTKLGRVKITREIEKPAYLLTDEDAQRDGFPSRDCVLWELARLNPNKDRFDHVYIYNCEVIK
jgi:hypothetical protein